MPPWRDRKLEGATKNSKTMNYLGLAARLSDIAVMCPTCEISCSRRYVTALLKNYDCFQSGFDFRRGDSNGASRSGRLLALPAPNYVLSQTYRVEARADWAPKSNSAASVNVVVWRLLIGVCTGHDYSCGLASACTALVSKTACRRQLG